jgi:methyltransferase (TIGR00027 family)
MANLPAGEIRDVSDTAIWVAQYRAQETERPDALFRDPLARLLVGERGPAIARSMGSMGRYTGWTLVIRTLIIDEYIRQAIQQGVDAVVNLGAGLDTRPYRLELPPSFSWVEADYAHMIDYKETMLREHTPRCRLQRVGVDLADAAARRDFLASVAPEARRVLVLTEGVVPYLTETQVAELAADLKSRPCFAGWILEYFSAHTYRYLKRRAQSGVMRNAPFQFFPADWDEFFVKRGWKRDKIEYFGDVGEKYNRVMPIPWWARLLVRLSNEEARQRMRTSMGYMLLTPS